MRRVLAYVALCSVLISISVAAREDGHSGTPSDLSLNGEFSGSLKTGNDAQSGLRFTLTQNGRRVKGVISRIESGKTWEVSGVLDGDTLALEIAGDPPRTCRLVRASDGKSLVGTCCQDSLLVECPVTLVLTLATVTDSAATTDTVATGE